jgi:hypothetical protein
METGKLRKMLKAPASVAKYAMLLLLGLSVSAQAAFWDGNKAHEICQTDRASVSVFVMGSIDAIKGINIAMRQNGTINESLPYCIPARVSGTQVGDIVCNYLSKNPRIRHLSSYDVIYTALFMSFPCK